jgi:hypothetical protein
VIALTVGGAYAKSQLLTGKDIRNNTLTTKDLKNNTVDGVDIGTNQVQTSDIGAGQVTPSDVTLPPPAEVTPPEAAGPVTTDGFSLLATVGAYHKTQAESTLNVNWSGPVASGPQTNCIYQIRVNGIEPVQSGGEAFVGSGMADISTVGLFAGLGEGDVSIQVWAKASLFVAGGGVAGPTCIIGPAASGIESTFVVTEEVQ